jgi:hypothetical protein
MTTPLTTLPAEHIERFDLLSRTWLALEPRFRDAAGRLASALKGGDADAVEAARKNVETLGRECGDLSARTEFAVRVLFKLRDGEGAEHLGARIDTMLAAVGRIGQAALKNFSASKTLLAAADQRLEQLRDDVSDRQRLWARADAWLRAAMADLADRRIKMEALAKKADAAVAARDAKALATVQKAAAAVAKPMATLAELRARVDDAIKTRGDVAPEHRKQFEADAKAWKDGLRAAEADDVQFGMDRDGVMALAIEARDVRKAARLLGIASGDIARLAKVLEADAGALLKGLEALAKQLKLEMPPKEMFALLKKAQLV